MEQSVKIASILLGYGDTNSHVLSYSLKEIFRNVFEHSGADECFLFIQKYRNDVVQFAVFDEGIGIRNSINKKYNIQFDHEAIRHAVLPGVSSSDVSIGGINPNDNSGYGLFVLSELGREFGWLEIGSGRSNCLFKGQQIIDQTLPSHDGVFIGLDLNTTDYDFEEKLSEIIHNGEVYARTLGHNPTASSSSRSY